MTPTNNTKTTTAMGILIALSFSHFFNDVLQAVVTAVYPLLKSDLSLTFTQIGTITLVYQISASVFQPIMGLFLDKRPNAWFLPLGMCFTFVGLVNLAYANQLWVVLLSVSLVGLGSSILHPEASRLTSLASGGKRGLAQSVFQVGGNTGSSLGPLLAALIIAPFGRQNTVFVALIGIIGIIAMIPTCRWYSRKLKEARKTVDVAIVKIKHPLNKNLTMLAIGVLLMLIFSKYMYMASLVSYYTFYLIERFGVSVQDSQIYLFVFLASTAVGTLIGGPIGDRIGRKTVIWVSILGASPFALLMPYAGLTGTVLLSVGVGLMLSSAFPAILLYAQELLPISLGLVSGLFFGFAFGIAGISSAVLGNYIDIYGIDAIYHVCSYFPLIGIVTYLLP